MKVKKLLKAKKLKQVSGTAGLLTLNQHWSFVACAGVAVVLAVAAVLKHRPTWPTFQPKKTDVEDGSEKDGTGMSKHTSSSDVQG